MVLGFKNLTKRSQLIKSAFVYILQCNDNSLYTGWTYDVEKRFEQHNNGTGARYTRARLPVNIVYFEELSSRSLAQKRECEIKKLTRAEKLKLIQNHVVSL